MAVKRSLRLRRSRLLQSIRKVRLELALLFGDIERRRQELDDGAIGEEFQRSLECLEGELDDGLRRLRVFDGRD